MKTLLSIIALLAICLTTPALAKKGKGQPAAPAAPETPIVEVSALSVTVSLGKSGEEHMTYKITDATKVSLNGAPVAARDLRAGMVAKVAVSADRTTATAIDAKDAPATGKRRR
jgi:hypothetical protein